MIYNPRFKTFPFIIALVFGTLAFSYSYFINRRLPTTTSNSNLTANRTNYTLTSEATTAIENFFKLGNNQGDQLLTDIIPGNTKYQINIKLSSSLENKDYQTQQLKDILTDDTYSLDNTFLQKDYRSSNKFSYLIYSKKSNPKKYIYTDMVISYAPRASNFVRRYFVLEPNTSLIKTLEIEITPRDPETPMEYAGAKVCFDDILKSLANYSYLQTPGSLRGVRQICVDASFPTGILWETYDELEFVLKSALSGGAKQ